MIKVAPSILAADFANLEHEINTVNTADYLHLDVMDGHFVPNISIGLPVVSSIRKITAKPLDVHLMISEPLKYAERFVKAGADILTFHVEAGSFEQNADTLRLIRSMGCRASLSLKPGTPAEAIRPYLPYCDMVLVMTVEPGFGGQAFMESQLEKISDISRMILDGGFACELEVDGGIDANTAPLVKQCGANVLVAGSAVFRHEDREAAISMLR